MTDPLDYHLWALSLIMGTPYRERPMHTRTAYDVTQLRYLRRVTNGRGPPLEPARRRNGFYDGHSQVDWPRRAASATGGG